MNKLGFILSCLLACTHKSVDFLTPTNEKSVAILYTTSVEGLVAPCGCTKDPLGGLDRLAGVIHAADKAYQNRTLFIDAGNLLFDTTTAKHGADKCQDDARLELLLRTYQTLGLFVTVVGAKDSIRGQKDRQELYAQRHIQAFDGEKTQTTTKRIGNTEIGIIGLAQTALQQKTLTKQLQKDCQVLREKGTDVVIALAQAKIGEVRDLFSKNTCVDFVIVGNEPGEKPFGPERLSEMGPFVLAAGQFGQFVGLLEVTLFDAQKGKRIVFDDRSVMSEKRQALLATRLSALKEQIKQENDKTRRQFLNERLKNIEIELNDLQKSPSKAPPILLNHFINKTITLDASVPAENDVKRAIDAYHKQLPELNKKCEANTECPKAGPQDRTYVGVQTCKTCHAAAVEFWQQALVKTDKGLMGHAHAWKTLVDKGKDSDRSCIGCHSIGFMQPGGYCRRRDVDFRINVQCESCHGPGSEHVAAPNKRNITRHVAESTCRSCHHVPHITSTESFIYNEKLKLILGKGHGEELLQSVHGQ